MDCHGSEEICSRLDPSAVLVGDLCRSEVGILPKATIGDESGSALSLTNPRFATQ